MSFSKKTEGMQVGIKKIREGRFNNRYDSGGRRGTSGSNRKIRYNHGILFDHLGCRVADRGREGSWRP